MEFVKNSLKLSGVFFLSFFSSFVVSACDLDNDIKDLFGVHFGENTLFDVHDIYGYVEIMSVGDAATSTSYACYILNIEGQNNFLIFHSDNEFAGEPEYSLTGIELHQSNKPLYDGCMKISNSDSVNRFSGLLKMSKAQVINKFKFIEDSQNSGQLSLSFCVSENLDFNDPYYSYWKDKEGCFGKNESPHNDTCRNYEAIFKNKLIKLILKRIVSIC